MDTAIFAQEAVEAITELEAFDATPKASMTVIAGLLVLKIDQRSKMTPHYVTLSKTILQKCCDLSKADAISKQPALEFDRVNIEVIAVIFL